MFFSVTNSMVYRRTTYRRSLIFCEKQNSLRKESARGRDGFLVENNIVYWSISWRRTCIFCEE